MKLIRKIKYWENFGKYEFHSFKGKNNMYGLIKYFLLINNS